MAEVLKLSADHSVVDDLVDKAEMKIDSALGFEAASHHPKGHHGPIVGAANMDISV